jgi:hypothetical protein
MEQNIDHNNNPRANKRLTLGIILLAIGSIYLISQLAGFILPHWLFSWPMWLIIIGVALGAKNNYRHPGAFVLIILGILCLVNVIAGYHLIIFWPLVLIAFGIRLVFFRDSHWCRSRWERRNQWRHHADYRDTL